jgi:hypothetical protein
LKSFLGDNAPSKIRAFSINADFENEPFSDTLEVETTKRDVQLRYTRETSATLFPSFRDFVSAANLDKVVENLKPFISGIVADPSKLLGRVFRPTI